jgi:hypothetical protein
MSALALSFTPTQPARSQSAPAGPSSVSTGSLAGLADTVALPAITVESPKQTPKPRQVARHNARSAAPLSQQPVVSSPATGPAATASGAPNVGSGPSSQPNMASQVSIAGDTLNARPTTRPGEILEAVPGLIVTQHSGEG